MFKSVRLYGHASGDQMSVVPTPVDKTYHHELLRKNVFEFKAIQDTTRRTLYVFVTHHQILILILAKYLPVTPPLPKGSTGVIRGLGAEVGVVVLELLLGEDVAEERLEVQRLAFLSPGRGYLLVDPDLSDTSF